MQLTLIVEYKRLFPESTEKIEELSRGIPRKLIIQAATTFLGMDSFSEESSNWRITLQKWFRSSNQAYAMDIANRIRLHYESQGLKPSIYSPITNLKLLQLGLDKNELEQEIEKSEEQIEIDLFKIYILLNGILAQRYLPNSSFIKETYPSNTPPFLLLYMGFAISDLINYSLPREMYCQSVKALYLFRFLSENEKIAEVTERFCTYYEVKNARDYFGMLLPLIRDRSKRKQEGFFEFNLIQDEHYDKRQRFISKLAVQKYDPTDDLDYKSIRSQPFVQMEENKFRITHPLFFTDKIYKGIYFDLSRLNSEAQPDKRIKEFRSFYGSEFSERFLFYAVMKYAFRKRFIQYTGQDFEAMKLTGRSDYYIRNSNSVFIFECKEVLINARIKENSISRDLEVEFKKKFLADGDKPKAVKQLVNNIAFIINKENDFDNDYRVQNLKIYPILVLHDGMFESAGFNYLLNTWFVTEIETLKVSGKEMPVIKPLVVLNIDTLILISDVLRDNRVTLKEVLKQYYIDTTFNPNRTFKDEEDFKTKLSNTYNPSNILIENWMKRKFPKNYPSTGLLNSLLNQIDQGNKKE